MGLLKKLAGQTAVYGISTIGARLLNYLLVPYLTRVMTDAEYGVVTDIYAFIPFALVVLTLGMESGYFRFAGQASSEEEKRRTFATAWGAVTLAASLFLGGMLLFCRPIAAATGYAAHPAYIGLTAWIVFFDVVTAIPFARLREQGRARTFVALKLLNVLINVPLCVFFYSLLPRLAVGGGFWSTLFDPSFGAGYYLVSNLVASAVMLPLLLPFTDRVRPRIDRAMAKKLLLYSLPLLVSGIAGTANEFLDRQMIKYLLPDDIAMGRLGIYGAAVKLSVIMVLFTQMYRYAAEPFFLARFKKDDFVRTNAEALKYYWIVSVLIFLGITLFTDLFALILGRDFREGVYLLPVMLGACILSGVVLNLSFWYKQSGQTKFAIWVTGSGLVVTIVFNLLLVPRIGIAGAAWARLLCEGVMVVVSYALNRKYCPTPYDLPRMAEYLLLGAVLYGLSFATQLCSPVLHYALNALLVGVFLLYAIQRERMWTMFRIKIG